MKGGFPHPNLHLYRKPIALHRQQLRVIYFGMMPLISRNLLHKIHLTNSHRHLPNTLLNVLFIATGIHLNKYGYNVIIQKNGSQRYTTNILQITFIYKRSNNSTLHMHQRIAPPR